jgi:hypothetical protein
MIDPRISETTEILRASTSGNTEALEQLTPLV